MTALTDKNSQHLSREEGMYKSDKCCWNETEGGAHADWLQAVIEAVERQKMTKVFQLLLTKGHRLTPGLYLSYHSRLLEALIYLDGDISAYGDEMVRWANRRWWRKMKAARDFEYMFYLYNYVFSHRFDVNLLAASAQ